MIARILRCLPGIFLIAVVLPVSGAKLSSPLFDLAAIRDASTLETKVIHDDRITAIKPVVAPLMGNPGGVVVLGTEPKGILDANRKFFADLEAGRLGLPPTALEALEGRSGRRVNVRVTSEQAKAAGWSDSEIEAMTARYWAAGRVVDILTVRTHEENDLPLTISSPYLRVR